MAHYHPVSYETEARIRQQEKLGRARRRRQAQAARAGRSHARPGLSILARLHGGLVTVVHALAPSSPRMN